MASRAPPPPVDVPGKPGETIMVADAEMSDEVSGRFIVAAAAVVAVVRADGTHTIVREWSTRVPEAHRNAREVMDKLCMLRKAHCVDKVVVFDAAFGRMMHAGTDIRWHCIRRDVRKFLPSHELSGEASRKQPLDNARTVMRTYALMYKVRPPPLPPHRCGAACANGSPCRNLVSGADGDQFCWRHR